MDIFSGISPFHVKGKISKWIILNRYAVLGDFEIEISRILTTNRFSSSVSGLHDLHGSPRRAWFHSPQVSLENSIRFQEAFVRD